MQYKTALFFFFLFMSKLGFSQADTLRLPLKKNIGEGPFKGGLRATYMDSIIEIKNLPTNIKEYIIKYVDFSYNPSKSETRDSLKMKLYFLVGFQSDSIAVIADLNNNLNFSDDKLLLYPKTYDTTKLLPFVNINISMGKKKFTYTFQPYPYSTNFNYFSKEEEIHYLMIKTYEYKTSDNFINNSPIYLINSKPSPIITIDEAVKIAVINKNDEFEYYLLGDAFINGNFRYFIDSVNPSGDTLIFIKTHIDSVQIGYSEGLTIRPFTVKNLKGENLTLPLKNKFTLIDFWGTWCAPCKELTPRLKSISNEFKSIVNIVSFAYDDDSISVKKYILKNKISWNNIIESSSKNQHPVIDAFRIQSFPTFILVDRNGKIISRGAGKEALKKIELILISTLSDKKNTMR